jgi:hypothetical protein
MYLFIIFTVFTKISHENFIHEIISCLILIHYAYHFVYSPKSPQIILNQAAINGSLEVKNIFGMMKKCLDQN